ncbi:MAG: polysaccharide deacetylase family protein [Kangiellaceae bacterium]|nr:polysaccharide deacetylase family protein [Kangiellaceae bacterium]MCW9015926.1 polysaccharide deacetylase family protein [Kangiellaceae bacterium]
MKKVKLVIYRVAKWTGIFHLFRKLTQNKLRILCYHGVSLDKEHDFFDKLFITKSTYEKRMKYLEKAQYPVVSLESAVKSLADESYPKCATVITFDDGWSGVHSEISDTMEEHNFPWTLYISTYYMNKQTQVFNIVFQFLLGTSSVDRASIILPGQETEQTFPLSSQSDKDNFYHSVSEAVYANMSAEERQTFLEQLALTLKVDASWIFSNGCFKYITTEQLKELFKRGVDMQLHTHRHIFPPENLEKSETEIVENRNEIERLIDNTTNHFCYPSGVYDKSQFLLLEKLGIDSATTVKNGLNDKNTNKYELYRFLDSESIQQIEFEAELCGFASFVRKVLR